MTYYVVTLDGIPMAVSLALSRATQMAKEMETSSRKAVIIPTRSLEDEFESEEPTLEDVKCSCEECLRIKRL